MFLCFPTIMQRNNCFHSLLKSLLFKNISLFVLCESSCGDVIPGVLSAVSCTLATISLLDSNASSFNLEKLSDDNVNKLSIFESDELKELLINNSDSLQTNGFISQNLYKNSSRSKKPFQVECLEKWYKPSPAVCNTLKNVLQPNICDNEMQEFLNMLKACYTDGKEINRKEKMQIMSPVQNELSEAEICSQSETVDENFDEICKDLSYEQLVSMTTDIYQNALVSNQTPVKTIKRIVNISSTFFLQKSIISFEESMTNFVREFFHTTSRNLIEEHASSQDLESTSRRIQECKLQVVLALEMEILFPSTETSRVNSIVSFLGALSLFTDATELGKFMKEVLFENYSHSLYDTLLDIGEDVGISLNPEDALEGDGGSLTSLDLLTDSQSSVASSIKSSSNGSNRSDNRKLMRRRSDISEANKSRQILLSASKPKKNKHQTALQRQAIRYSPRLASRKRREKNKSHEAANASTVRRNLFPSDGKIKTPRTSRVYTGSPAKKKVLTPRGHHVLKTCFVPNTPSHKRSKSALQRRKSQMDSVEKNREIGESPTVSKNAKDVNILKRLQELKESPIASTSRAGQVQRSSLPGCSFRVQHTPESKRRLSLKLFSKLLPSPTARVGLKKCSKRLFDQFPSQSSAVLPNKRMKFNSEAKFDEKHKNTLPKTDS